VVAPISYGDAHHYVISHRTGDHTVSYRPPGQHHHVGSYKTERDAKAAAQQHADTGTAPPSNTASSIAAWGPGGPPKEWRGHATKKRAGQKGKSKAQLDREIAQSLASSGEPQLAAIFADPEARKVFGREMRHEIQKRQTSEKTAAGLAARPYTVKHAVGDRRELLGRYATESEARAAADRVGGWIEHEGRVIYGQAPTSHATRRRTGRAHATKGSSWEAVAADYKRRAKAAREAGGKVKIYPDGSILVVPTEGSDEYFYQDWQADEFREGIEYRNSDLLQHVSFEDLVLAQSQDW
jgi:hypothetical protein